MPNDSSRTAAVAARLALYASVLTLIMATFSRLLVAYGAPDALNFVHYPLTLITLLLALESRRPPKRAAQALSSLALLLCVGYAGWLLSGSEPLRPFFGWLVPAEPVLFASALAVILQGDHDSSIRGALRVTICVVVICQLPLAAYQFSLYGIGDFVQGSFVYQGNGAHVAGAVALLGSLFMASRALHLSMSLRRRIIWLAGALSVLPVAVLTDAKQVIGAVIPAAGLLVLGPMRQSARSLVAVRRSLVALLLTTTMFALVFVLYQPFQTATTPLPVSDRVEGKLLASREIAAAMQGEPLTFVVGLSPGTTVSRVSLLTRDAHLEDSAVGQLGFETTDLTRRILALGSASYLIESSSLWSPLSSWVGLWGDFGPLGLVLYVTAWALLLVAAARDRGPDGLAAFVAALMAATLGLMYSWLEEPSFMLIAATVVALPWGGKARATGLAPKN